MSNKNMYAGREQTYIKHFVLKNYLERVAYNIYSYSDSFVYVDGFSGPWRSENENYDDTSFKIAIEHLRGVREGVNNRPNKSVNFRCLFIEKDKDSYGELKNVVDEISDVPIRLINGSFEDSVSEVISFVRGDFSLVFIDPTGWDGFPMGKIAPLFSLRGEILINFMSDFINRFIEDSRPEISKSFEDLFGSGWYPEWRKLHESGLSREAAAIEVYTSRLKQFGGFRYVTYTRILKPMANRSYFYLIYATRHWKGIKEFRRVEKRAIDEQEDIRNEIRYKHEVSITRHEDLFGPNCLDGIRSYDGERSKQLERGLARFFEALRNHRSGIKYEELLGEVLETPMVWESDLKSWISELRRKKEVEVMGMTPTQRVPKSGNKIVLLSW